MKKIYASDLDRTLIFSYRFIEEYVPNCKYEIVETVNGKVISYMASDVRTELEKIKLQNDIEFIPVTTRSIAEYKRINLGVNPHFAIVGNGGTILVDGEPMKEWEEYILPKINFEELELIENDLDSLSSTIMKTKLIDGKYAHSKVEDCELYDREVEKLKEKYKSYVFTRQNKKVYIIPDCFSKDKTLLWLKNYIGAKKIYASGDSFLDIPMLKCADVAIIPKHGDLIKQKVYNKGILVKEGIDSPLETIKILRQR